MISKGFSYRSLVLDDPEFELAFLTLDHDELPRELKTAKRWIGWKSLWDLELQQWGRVPVAKDGTPIDCLDEGNWLTFEEVCAQQDDHECDGIAFLLGRDNDGRNFAGVNLDDCRNPRTEELSSLAKSVLAEFDTYAELSPTGTGIKLFCFGELRDKDVSRFLPENIEVFDCDRYFAFTGQQVPGTPLRIADREQELNAFCQRHAEGNQTVSGESENVLCQISDLKFRHLASECLAASIDLDAKLVDMCCRGVELGLEDHVLANSMRQHFESEVSTREYSDMELLRIIYEAERWVDRGSAATSLAIA